MSETQDLTLIGREYIQRGELQMTLMKMVAEQSKEKFLEYDCATDRLVISEVRNGQFVVRAEISDFFSKENANQNYNKISIHTH